MYRTISKGTRAVSIYHQGGQSKYDARLYVNCKTDAAGWVKSGGDATLTAKTLNDLASAEAWAHKQLGSDNPDYAKLRCNECGSDLQLIYPSEESNYGASVVPCEVCMESQADHGYDNGRFEGERAVPPPDMDARMDLRDV